MGLFSKKKELPLASDPFQSENPQFGLDEIPPPPPSLNEPIGPANPPPDSQMPPTFPPQPELPAFDSQIPTEQFSSPIPSPPALATKTNQLPPIPPSPPVANPVTPTNADIPIPQPKQGFELPDFDEEEIRNMEKLIPEPEKAAEQNDQFPENDEITPEPETTGWAEESQKETLNHSDEEKITSPINKIPYPEKEPAEIPKNKFLELKTFFTIKDEVEELRVNLRNMDESIEKQSSKAKLEKYHSLGNTLNKIQEKIMLIDNKLFEP